RDDGDRVDDPDGPAAIGRWTGSVGQRAPRYLARAGAAIPAICLCRGAVDVWCVRERGLCPQPPRVRKGSAVMKKFVLGLAAGTVMTASIAAAGQQRPEQAPREETRPEIIAAWGSQRFVDAQFGNRRAHDVLRVGSDYTLKTEDESGDLVVIAGKGTVEGAAHDVVVVFGTADIASTADIRGSLVLIDADANVAAGARVHGDLVVVGGQFKA